jgi:hypothetical protein
MADRYQDRPFPADDDYDRGDDLHASAKGESDPLAELARLIGQTDPFATMGRANQPVQPRSGGRDHYDPPAVEDDAVEDEDGVSAGPPPWMQRVARQEAPQQDYYPSAVHPLHRYAAAHPAPEPDYDQAPPFADEADQQPDPSRYDDALYGQLGSDLQETPHGQAYSDDPYGYQDEYAEAEEPVRKRRGGIVTVVVVLALAVLGTGAAFAYRTYVGSPRSGEPPIIKADTGPTKIVPASADANAKVPDRLAAGDGTERIVPREEAPVDVNAQSAPRMVFPPLNQNANPPTVASVTPSSPPPVNAGNGTLPNNEPRRIKTFSVRGDQPEEGASVPATSTQPPAAKPATAARATTTRSRPVPSVAANANASTANAPLSLSPTPAAEPRTRVATNTPVQTAPSGGGYLVQVSSQRNEADAHASYRVLQSKYPAVLGSRSPVIKRADLGEKGVYYRAMVGPFGSREEALQLCGSLENAGGKCVVQRN